MKMRFMLCAGFAILAGLVAAGTSWPQQSPGVAASQPTSPQRPYYDYSHLGGSGEMRMPGESNVQQNIHQLVDQLRQAEDAKKADLTKQLETEVSKYFDIDMQLRMAELKKLQEQLTKLGAQLDRRSKAKDEIIQLQVKMLVNEAEGLGFGQSSYDPYRAKSGSPVPVARPARQVP